MTTQQLEYLEWDSDFFGLKTGKVSFEGSDLQGLEKALEEASSEKYRLVYCFTPTECAITDTFLHTWNGVLTDEKVVFMCTEMAADKPGHEIETVPQDCSAKDMQSLKELALVSGKYSRFRMDANFPPGSFSKLYHAWIEKSVYRALAGEVYVVREQHLIRGMMTVKYLPNKAEIGLIAVSPEAQGKSIGADFMKYLKQACLKKRIPRIEVTTQGQNQPACSFYERNNFQIFSRTNIFHFWLQ